MVESVTRATFLSLPTELRLQIAAYALEQPPNVALTNSCNANSLDPKYTSASNLSILLVCRQFRDGFIRLAYQKTTFMLGYNASRVINERPEERLKDLRKLIIQWEWSTISIWREYPFNKECIHLDELGIAMPCPIDHAGRVALVSLLRRLQNVDCIWFIPHAINNGDHQYDGDHQYEYNTLIGALLKEDHYQRYDAPNAPNLESTWWNWSHNEEENNFMFVAQEPKPNMEEEDYMLFVKPKVDEVMESMSR